MRRKGHIVFLSIAVGLLMMTTGCSIGHFTFLATKNLDLSNFSTENAEKSAQVTGEDHRPVILFFPTGIPNLKEAVNKAEEQGNAKALTNATLYYGDYWVLLFGDKWFKATGNPLRQ